jgi:ABC-type branched-subunit amino acid transport system ATPase component
MNAIEVEGLYPTFNDLRAVDNISFAVEAGEIIRTAGPRGSTRPRTRSATTTLDHLHLSPACEVQARRTTI